MKVNSGTRVAPLQAGRWVILAFPPLRGVPGQNPKGPTPDGSPSPTIQDVLPLLLGQVDTRLSDLKQWLINLEVRSKPGEGVSNTEAGETKRLVQHFFRIFNAFVPGTDIKFEGINRKTWQVNIKSHGSTISLEQLSQGANSILGWVGALLQRIYEIHGSEDLENVSGRSAVVLIDEIDAHLHPDWQQRIVRSLSEQFPSVQFIVTAHSPLIVGELKQNQIYRMRRRDDNEVVADHPRRSLKGLGVAGVLTSDMFGLTTTVDTDTNALLEEQRVLSAKDTLTEAEEQRLGVLGNALEELGFWHQVRDPAYAQYLKEKRRAEKASTENPAGLKRIITDMIGGSKRGET